MTPASSEVSNPTITFASDCLGSLRSTQSSAAGLNLLAQPAAFTPVVNRTAVAILTPQRFSRPNELIQPYVFFCLRGWRKHMGVEPTIRIARTRNIGFEDRGKHRFPRASASWFAREQKISIWSLRCSCDGAPAVG